MATLCVKKEIKGNICVLRPCGYVDDKGGAALVEAVEAALSEDFLTILINFSESPVINSQGIAQIIELAEIVVDEKGGDLAFCSLNEIAASVFKMVGLFQMGDAYKDENEALSFLQ